jgi:hypothetical protein
MTVPENIPLSEAVACLKEAMCTVKELKQPRWKNKELLSRARWSYTAEERELIGDVFAVVIGGIVEEQMPIDEFKNVLSGLEKLFNITPKPCLDIDIAALISRVDDMPFNANGSDIFHSYRDRYTAMLECPDKKEIAKVALATIAKLTSLLEIDIRDLLALLNNLEETPV